MTEKLINLLTLCGRNDVEFVYKTNGNGPNKIEIVLGPPRCVVVEMNDVDDVLFDTLIEEKTIELKDILN